MNDSSSSTWSGLFRLMRCRSTQIRAEQQLPARTIGSPQVGQAGQERGVRDGSRRPSLTFDLSLYSGLYFFASYLTILDCLLNRARQVNVLKYLSCYLKEQI